MLWGSRRLAVLAAGAAAVPLLAAWRAYRTERRSFIVRRHAPRLGLADFAVPGLVATSFPARGGARLGGYYAPPRAGAEGAAVVLAHGACGERSDVADEARLLARAGLGVLAFDWPGHGESEGRITWSESERQALLGALDWLAVQPGVAPDRLGAFGFSMGGHTVLQVAAGDPRVRAVAVAGTPHDPVEHTRWEYRRWGRLRQWPALLALRVSGMQLQELVPERVIAAIAPRPLLVVTGSEDQQVPAWMAERLTVAAREPKQLLVVEGAAHGGYYQAEPERYSAALRELFLRLAH